MSKGERVWVREKERVTYSPQRTDQSLQKLELV